MPAAINELAAQCLFLAGPTASGKSALALALAEQLGGEIISADSMQVYRGLDLGTAKPTPAERARVPHHLVDICELTEAFDAASFVRLAQTAAQAILARRRVPILCGGTGLYLKAFLKGLDETPPSDPALRDELSARPLAELLAELQARDPVAYTHIDRQNPRRVIRALEVIRLTGHPFSAQRADWSAGSTASNTPASARRFFCLRRDTDDLRRRINHRVDEMFRCGLVEETRALLAAGLDRNPVAMQAIGYRQVVEYLRGERTLPETIEQVKARTRQFAKRQLTWFRLQTQATWLPIGPEETVATSLRKLLAQTDYGS